MWEGNKAQAAALRSVIIAQKAAIALEPVSIKSILEAVMGLDSLQGSIRFVQR